MRSTLALALLLALATSAARAADEPPKIPADGAPPVTTESGLVYSVLTAGGEGRKPKNGDLVTVHYTGWTEKDAKVFDSSRARGKPNEFPVADRLKGWIEALLLMSPGARWKLTIPPTLGYGDQSGIPDIPPGSTLVFDVELISVRSIPQFTFQAADTAKQRTTASGLKVEVLKEGEGAQVTADDSVELAYAVWNMSGKLLESSSPAPGRRATQTIKAPVKTITIAGLKEAALLLKLGGRVRVEMPAAIGIKEAMPPDLPAGAVSVWELELLAIKSPLPCPPFARSEPSKVRKTASGLEIETLEVGTGKTPKQGDPVTVHYAGWLTNGTLFDSSYARGEPMTFSVGGVIEGWNEALKQMQEGGKVRLTIPPGIAYGAMGSGDQIPPNATLIFYVELIKVGT